MGLLFSPLAAIDLEEIGDHIARDNLNRPEASGVLIIRVLHGAMDLPRHMGAQGTAARDGDEPDPEATADIEAGKPK